MVTVTIQPTFQRIMDSEYIEELQLEIWFSIEMKVHRYNDKKL